MIQRKHRLLTRSDFDGLVCAMLLKDLDLIDEIAFVHPKDVQDGKVVVSPRDIMTNLPYSPNCHLCFDHHDSEGLRNGTEAPPNLILAAGEASAARVVYDHFGGAQRFPHVATELLEAVDVADSALFSREDVLRPTGWTLLSFIMDPRTGLGRFRGFRISNYDLMMLLIDACRDKTSEEVLALPDVKERVELYRTQQVKMVEQLGRCATVHGPLVEVDYRDEETIYCGNRFIVYAAFPECNVSMHVLWGKNRQNTVFAIGKSIFDRSNPSNLGDLALEYGGGGHEAAATCQIANDDAERVREELIGRLVAEATGAKAVSSRAA
jgi:nanoRNase/pAp phosphatase (c-di-AMP/oligoRNAs hydrolase)